MSGDLIWMTLNHFKAYLLLLWDLDPNYNDIRSRGCGRFHTVIEEKLLGYNNPKKHGHAVQPFDTARIEQTLLQVEMKLDHKYMDSSHMKLLNDMIRRFCETVQICRLYILAEDSCVDTP